MNLPPQRILFPFSLVVEHGDGRNAISPGWVFSNSAYTIARSEEKFATRRKAKSHSYYTGWKIFRPETINLCIAAREMLRKASGKKIFFGEKEVEGIGKNALTEKSRIAGIKTYTEIVQLYALRGLLNNVENGLKQIIERGAFKIQEIPKSWKNHSNQDNLFSSLNKTAPVTTPLLPWDYDCNEEKLHINTVLILEFNSMIQSNLMISVPEIVKLLHKLIIMEDKFADSVARSKSKDDYRGKRVIPGYSAAHINYENDKVVKTSRRKVKQTKSRVEKVEKLLGNLSRL